MKALGIDHSASPSMGRKYTQVIDFSKPKPRSEVIGLSYKFAKGSQDPSRSVSRVMPTYGLYDQSSTMKTTKVAIEPSTQEIHLELENHNKYHFKQKYFEKQFIENCIRANVNPNKR